MGRSDHGVHWQLDPGAVFINHGSFGATPIPVMERQWELRQRMERQPLLFLDRELEGLLDEVRGCLGEFLGARAEDLVFVPNATTAVNAVFNSTALRDGDEVLLSEHAYNACYNVVIEACRRSGARPVLVPTPFPGSNEDAVVGRWLGAVTQRTRLAMLDHITSPTALVMPVERLVGPMREMGVVVLVDGAHAPGQLPLNLDLIGADFYTGNCHKWLCAPKGAAFLHVRGEHQGAIRPPVISHGANSSRRDRSRFHLEFDWPGTWDPTAILSIPTALAFLKSLMSHEERMVRNHDLVLRGRQMLLELFEAPAPCPEGMLGSMAAVPLPPWVRREGDGGRFDPLALWLWQEHRIEVPVIKHSGVSGRLIRISAQLYNSADDYAALSEALAELRP